MSAALKGIYPAIASPCDEHDAFLEDQFAALVKRLYASGADGLYICGATGDGYKMRLEDRKRAAEIAVTLSAEHGRETIVHVGTLNTRDTVVLAEHAARTGAAAVSSLPPANSSHRELVDYYTAVARAAELPVLVYYIPMLTKLTSTVEEMLELLDIDGVVGLKLTDWNLFYMKRLLLARPGITLFSGFDEFLLPGLLYGAGGGIGTWYNLFPKLFIGIYQAAAKGDIARAQQLQDVFMAFGEFGWQYGVKQVFTRLYREMGLGEHCFRQPCRALTDSEWQAIRPEVMSRVAAIEALL